MSIAFTNLAKYVAHMDEIIRAHENAIVKAVETVAEYIGDQASRRAPVNPELAPTLMYDYEVTPAHRQGLDTTAMVEFGGKASDYAYLQHETLEIGESGYSADPQTGEARTNFAIDGVRRLGKLSVEKDRSVKAQGIRVGGKFLARAIEENEKDIQEIFDDTFSAFSL
ncbi:MAG: hypothetical protein HQM11_07665 [SAR324 cluster bacterium]|nr:hypothetical protein [SAR324 cluster bacterium]